MSMPLKWEFPGGKIEAEESAAQCLEREVMEELGISIGIEAALPPSHWRYANFGVTLHPFICRIKHGTIQLAEHKAICWIKPEDMTRLDWAEADGPVLENYFNYIRSRRCEA